jgi:undecaprenyl-diphosphatase
MEIWKAIVLGIVEGATEFIPVSSTGHLIIANAILGVTGETAASFDVCIQGGAILAVVLLYRERFTELISIGGLNQTQKTVGIAVVPFLVAGAILGGSIKAHLFGVVPVAYGLLVGGVLLIVAARRYQQVSISSGDQEIASGPSVKQALVVGICQLGALWPGMSRSACTIIGGLMAGMSLKDSAQFSFIIAAPILLAASAKDGLHALQTFSPADLIALGVGFFVSFVFAVLSLKLFLRLLSAVGLSPFGWYRIGLGSMILLLVHFSVL